MSAPSAFDHSSPFFLSSIPSARKQPVKQLAVVYQTMATNGQAEDLYQLLQQRSHLSQQAVMAVIGCLDLNKAY